MKYNITVAQLTSPGRVRVMERCNGWVVVNKGTAPIWVNGFPLLPAPSPTVSGESYGVSGNEGEVYQGDIDITTNNPAGFFCVVVQKYFTGC